MSTQELAVNTGQKIVKFFDDKKGLIASALPAHMKANVERWSRTALTAIRKNPSLTRTDIVTLCSSIVEAATLGLDIDQRGLAYLVPYGRVCQLQIGYKGLMDLAYRTGTVSYIDAQVVYSEDKFSVQYGTDPKIEHVPANGQRGEKVGSYAVAFLKDGSKAFRYVDAEYIAKVRGTSPSAQGKGSPWHNWEEAMWMKTAVRQLVKFLPTNPELLRAVTLDEAAEAGVPQQFTWDVDLLPEAGQAEAKMEGLRGRAKAAAEQQDDGLQQEG